MSALDVFTKRALFRRLWLFAVGLLLGYAYITGFIEDLYITPATIGVLIGLLSAKPSWGVINSILVMFGLITSILVIVMAQNIGIGAHGTLELYRDLIANSFVAGLLPMMGLLPGLLVGFVVRFLFLFLRSRERERMQSK